MHFLYDGDALVAEYDAWGTLAKRYVHGPGVDEPLVEGSWLGERRHLHANHQGSIVAVTDAGGNTLRANSFDAWGIPGADNLGRFSYTGQAYLKEVGLYHYKARIYSATLGRFLQTDPIGYEDQVNLYAYVGNDPLNAIDPSGECTVTRRTAAFCRQLEESGRRAELIEPINAPISGANEAALLQRVGFRERGPGQWSAAMGIPGYKLWGVRSAQRDAERDTAIRYPRVRSLNNEADAYKHANMSIRLERHLSNDDGESILDGHERITGNPRGERAMDLMNNHNGMILSDVFPNMGPADLSGMAVEAQLLQTRPVVIRWKDQRRNASLWQSSS